MDEFKTKQKFNSDAGAHNSSAGFSSSSDSSSSVSKSGSSSIDSSESSSSSSLFSSSAGCLLRIGSTSALIVLRRLVTSLKFGLAIIGGSHSPSSSSLQSSGFLALPMYSALPM